MVGNGLNSCPEQIVAIGLKVGVTLGLIVTIKVVVVAHCPLVGVNVYVVVALLFNAGVHVPVIPFNEVVGNGLNSCPEQIGAIVLKVGVTFELTVIVKVVVVAHCPEVGENLSLIHISEPTRPY